MTHAISARPGFDAVTVVGGLRLPNRKAAGLVGGLALLVLIALSAGTGGAASCGGTPLTVAQISLPAASAA